MKKILLSALLISSLAIDASAVTYAYEVAANYTGSAATGGPYALSTAANFKSGNTSISSNYNKSGKWYVNAGHGGFDSDDRPTPMPLLGGEYFYESEGNLDRALHMEQWLIKNGGTVKMSRRVNTSAYDLNLTSIASYSSSYGGYFISMHSNGANASANYHIALYKGSNSTNSVGGSERMAYWNSYNNYKNGCLTNYTYSTPRSMADYDLMGWHYGVLRTNTQPGYLVETWFHDYRPESLRFKSSLYNKFLAWQIAVGNMTAPGGSGSLPGCVVGDVRDKSQSCGYSNYTARGRDLYLAVNNANVTLSGNGINYTVSTGAKCNGVFAFFVPAGTYTLTVAKDGYKTQTHSVTVSVNKATQKNIDFVQGTNSGISLNPTSTGFGQTYVGGTSSKTVTVTGTDLTANISIASSNTTDFKISHTSLGTTGGTITVTYQPKSVGSHNTTLTFTSGSHKSTMVVSGTAVNPPLSFTEGWNYSETSNKKAAWMANWTSYRNMAFGDGKLYVVDVTNNVVKVIKAQTCEHLYDLDMTGVTGGALALVDVAYVDGKLIGTNIALSSNDTMKTLKVYIWDNDESAPRVLLETTNLGGMTRIGDTVDYKGTWASGQICYFAQQTRDYTDSDGNTVNGNCNSLVTYAVTNGVASTDPVVADIDAFIAGLSPRAVPDGDNFWVLGQHYHASQITPAGELVQSIPTTAFNLRQTSDGCGNDFVPFKFKGTQYAFATDYAAVTDTDGDGSISSAEIYAQSLLGGRAILIDGSEGWAVEGLTNEGGYPSAGLSSKTRNTSYSTSICVNVNGTSGVEMWVLVHNQGIAYYKHGTAPTYTYENVPTISVGSASLSFATKGYKQVSKDIVISGAYLSDDITLSISGTNADQFEVSATKVTQTDGNANATVTVTYNPETAATHKATLTLSSTGASTVNVALTGTNEEEYVITGFGLTQLWAQTSGHLTANTNTRWATGIDDKIYINDHANSKLYYWAKGGLTDTGISTAAGTAITSDDKGNIIISTGMYTAGCTSYKVMPSGSTTLQDLTITMPDGVTANQQQYLGQAIGDIMSSEGGAMFIFPKDATSVAKIIIKNGAQVSATAISVGAITADAQSIAVPLTKDINSNSIAARVRANKYFYVSNGTEFVAQSHENVNLTAGGTYFTLQNILFAVEPIGTNYKDGFQVVNTATGEIVASHAEQITADPAAKPNANCLSARVVDELTAQIYQYVPGQLASIYKFEVKRTTGVEDAIANPEEVKASIYKAGNTLYVAGVEAKAVGIYSMSGAMVRMVNNVNEVAVDGLNGIYVVVAVDANGVTHTKKLVIR